MTSSFMSVIIIRALAASVSYIIIICINSKDSVITGSTDGIGKAYAFELAKQQFSIVLISRTQSKLDDVKKELEEKYGVDVSFFICCI